MRNNNNDDINLLNRIKLEFQISPIYYDTFFFSLSSFVHHGNYYRKEWNKLKLLSFGGKVKILIFQKKKNNNNSNYYNRSRTRTNPITTGLRG